MRRRQWESRFISSKYHKHTHTRTPRYDTMKNPILWTLISCAAVWVALFFVDFCWFLQFFLSFAFLLSIPLFVYRLVRSEAHCTTCDHIFMFAHSSFWFDFLSTEQHTHTQCVHILLHISYRNKVSDMYSPWRRKREQAQKNGVHFYLSPSSHWFENRLFCTLIVPLPPCPSARMAW